MTVLLGVIGCLADPGAGGVKIPRLSTVVTVVVKSNGAGENGNDLP
jgi:hypothetical protein